MYLTEIKNLRITYICSDDQIQTEGMSHYV